MGKQKQNSIRIQAEDLYVIDCLSVPQICTKLELKKCTVYRWCNNDNWKLKRDEYIRQLGSIRKNIRRLRYLLSEKAVSTLDAQDIYAFERMERLSRKYDDDINDGEDQQGEITPEDIKQAADKALKRLSQSKNLKINEIKEALRLAEEMRNRDSQNEKKQKESVDKISPQTLEKVKQQLYGL